MKVFKIVVRREQQLQQQAQFDAFISLLGAYRHDGHVLGLELMTLSLDQHLEAHVFAAAGDAFNTTTQNKWITQRTDELKATGLSTPEFIELGEDPTEADGCTCTNSTSFILFTTYIQLQSPIRCGDCFRPVPLYRLPRFKNDEFTEVISWTANWKACDSLFMGSTIGEAFGYREMSEADSSLSQQGRIICNHFERLTGKPTYYYLHRYYGRSKTIEKARKCPNCKGDWRLAERWHGLFDFKCEKCRLVSCISSAVG